MPKIYSVTSDEGNANDDSEPVVDKKKNIPPPPPFLQNFTPNVVKLNESNENNIENNNNVGVLSPIYPMTNITEISQSFEEQQPEVIKTIEPVESYLENDHNNLESQNISQNEENVENHLPTSSDSVITIETQQISNIFNQVNQQEPPPPINNSIENQSLDSSDEIPMANRSNSDDFNNTELLFELYTTKIKALLQKKFLVLNSIDSRVKELEKRELELSELNELKEKVNTQQDVILKLTEELQIEKEERINLENKFEELKQSISLINDHNNNENEIQKPRQQQQQIYSSNTNNDNNFYSKLNTQWVKYYDEGVPYYYNVVNNKSMWEIPTEGFMEEWTYNSLYEEYANNNNHNNIEKINTNNTLNSNSKQYYYKNNNQQQQNQMQTEEEINKKAERVKEVWTEFFTNALQTKMKQKLQQSPPSVEHRQIQSNGVEEPLLQTYHASIINDNNNSTTTTTTTAATDSTKQNYTKESYPTTNETEKEEIEKESKEAYHHQNTSNYDKSSAMIMAIEKGDVNTVNKILDNNPNPDIPDSKQRYPLYMAVSNCQLEIVKILVNAGANIDRKCINGRTPLHVAVGNNDYSIVSYLLSIGTKVNITDNNQDTPLHLAAISGNFEITKLLIRKGADPMKTNKLGLTPFECAAQTISLYKDVPQSLYDTIDLLKERTPDKYDTDNESLNTSDEESDNSPVQSQKQSKWFSFW